MQHKKMVEEYLAPRPYIYVFGVKYLHLRLPDGADLYLTEEGQELVPWVLPQNHWEDKDWCRRNRERLPGSSTVFRVTTKEVDKRAINIVLKWNRMGQDIPGETKSDAALAGAEFNSPFMEFSLVHEMRNTSVHGAAQIRTQKPLAIYVPHRFHAEWQLGRKRHRMRSIARTHQEINLDWKRSYAVIYEWLAGIDSVEAHEKGLLSRQQMVDLYYRSNRDLKANGFRMHDNKPQHLIVKPQAHTLARDQSGLIEYELVDFELLERTPEREELVRSAKRRDYLARQAKRFESREPLLPGLSRVTIMGVDYIYGEVESTNGGLWVVGHDPLLFDYFLPEKWRQTPRTRLVENQQWYETTTKDDVHIVWRVSCVGQRPNVDPFFRTGQLALEYGYNSPFEEFSIALELMRQGIDTKYPRAIYMTGPTSDCCPADRSRYDSHAGILTPDGSPILKPNHQYVTIWGFWNAPDDVLAVKDADLYEGIDALTAFQQGRLTQRQYLQIMEQTKERLSANQVDDLGLCGSHLLLSSDKANRIALDQNGLPLVRIRSFELLKRTAAGEEG